MDALLNDETDDKIHYVKLKNIIFDVLCEPICRLISMVTDIKYDEFKQLIPEKRVYIENECTFSCEFTTPEKAFRMTDETPTPIIKVICTISGYFKQVYTGIVNSISDKLKKQKEFLENNIGFRIDHNVIIIMVKPKNAKKLQPTCYLNILCSYSDDVAKKLIEEEKNYVHHTSDDIILTRKEEVTGER